MSRLIDKVQQNLIRAIDQDELVLPTLPEVALQVRETAEDPDVSTQALSKVIGNDAALTAHITRVVNSLLLRNPKEITDLQMAISRLDINYTYNLVTGPAMEQMFRATIDVVDREIHEVWDRSTGIAGICRALARYYTCLTSGQATLVGLVYQIDVLPILIYTENHNGLLSDSVSLSHAIERIHPLIGERILRTWDSPAPIAGIPHQHLDLTRNSPHADYTDLVRITTLQSCLDNKRPYTRLDWSQIPMFAKLNLGPTAGMKEDEGLSSALETVTNML